MQNINDAKINYFGGGVPPCTPLSEIGKIFGKGGH